MTWWKRGVRREEAVDREIAEHVARLSEDYVAQGMTAEEARRRAWVEFGGREQVKQAVREVHLWAFGEKVGFHLETVLRFLRKAPGFSLAVILTLALGIGANSAVFSAIDAIVLRPLAFPHGDELVRLYQHDAHGRDSNTFVAPQRLEDWNRLTTSFAGITGYYKDDLSDLSGALPEKVTWALVAPRFLSVLGVAPALGRNFVPDEEHFGGPNAVLISYAYWQRRLRGDPGVLERKLRFGQFTYSIAGVMPQNFTFPDRDVELWTPSPPDAPYARRRDETWFTVIGRMKPGVTLSAAAADLANVQGQLGRQFPKPDAELTTSMEPLKATVIGNIGQSLWLLYGSVSLLLLISCSNIAALLLARTAEREQEIAIRFSLGAARKTIVQQLLSEVLGLSVLGGLAGMAVAAGAARGFHMLAEQLPRAQEVQLDWRVAGYSLACAVVTALLCGLYPALRGTRNGLAKGLTAGGRTQVSARNPMQWMLVGMQVALAVLLLAGAGLLLRSLDRLSHVDAGFDPSHVLTLQVSGSWGETTNLPAMMQRIDRTLDGLRTLPGVEDAATAAMLPGVSELYQTEFTIDGKADPARKILADTRWVSSGYFSTMTIPILAGEPCAKASTPPQIVVNRTFANLYLSGGTAIGHMIKAAGNSDFGVNGMVRGVVADAREEGLNEPPAPTVYSCYSAPTPFPNYLIRTKGEPMAMADAIRKRIHMLEPARSVYAVMPLEQHLSDAFTEDRLRTMLLTVFAISAVALACIGLYGTLSYLVRRRQREVGVRLALGAMREQIVGRFLLQGLRVVAIGSIVGLLAALFLSRFLRGMLFGVSPLDPATYVAVVGVILTVAAMACLVPALRAAFVEPIKVLRED